MARQPGKRHLGAADENGRVDFEDSSLGSVAFILGMYANVNEKPDTVIKRYYDDLFEREE